MTAAYAPLRQDETVMHDKRCTSGDAQSYICESPRCNVRYGLFQALQGSTCSVMGGAVEANAQEFLGSVPAVQLS